MIRKIPIGRSLKYIFSEPMVFAILTFLFLLVFTPSIQTKYHFLYRSLFVICIIALVFKKEILNILFSKYSFPIILCLFIFFIFWFIDYGDRSTNTLKSFIRGLVIFLMAFTMARQAKSFQIMSILLFCALLFSAQQMMEGRFFSTDIMVNRVSIVNAVATNLNLTNKEYLTVSSYVVVFVAYICFSATLAFSFLDFSSKFWVKVLVFGAFLSTLMFCLKSLWTAPIIILALSLLTIRGIHIYSLSAKKTDRKILEILKSILIFIIFISVSTCLFCTYASCVEVVFHGMLECVQTQSDK